MPRDHSETTHFGSASSGLGRLGVLDAALWLATSSPCHTRALSRGGASRAADVGIQPIALGTLRGALPCPAGRTERSRSSASGTGSHFRLPARWRLGAAVGHSEALPPKRPPTTATRQSSTTIDYRPAACPCNSQPALVHRPSPMASSIVLHQISLEVQSRRRRHERRLDRSQRAAQQRLVCAAATAPEIYCSRSKVYRIAFGLAGYARHTMFVPTDPCARVVFALGPSSALPCTCSRMASSSVSLVPRLACVCSQHLSAPTCLFRQTCDS